MWIYKQKSGNLFQDNRYVGNGYSGAGEGKNNPAMQHVQNVGPIPCGTYSIGDPFDSNGHGPFVMRLTPADDATRQFCAGRDGFLIHGDSMCNPGTASHGCIIQALVTRRLIHASGDKLLKVISQ